MIRRFIERPVLSTVISIIIVILGILGYILLPVSLYPRIALPTVQVSANYPGANAQTVKNSVVGPLEQRINGVEGMEYITSTSSNNGRAQINVHFGLDTDPDIDAVNVQNRVAQAQSQLPQEVTKRGVTTEKQQTSRLLIFSLVSNNNKYDSKFVENYARINLIPKLKRVKGVGTADAFGAGTYTMRIWLKPSVLASYNLSPQDVITALNNQSFVAAPGAIGKTSDQSFQYKMVYKGRLSTAKAYKNIIIREGSENAQTLRLRDVARVELGAASYSYVNRTNGKPSVGLFVSKRPGANAQTVIQNVQQRIEQASKTFPPGVDYVTLFNVNSFLSASISKVYETLIEAFILVFVVVFIFLQDWRSVLIPAVAVPVSIIGTLFFLNLFGFSLNLLTLFALVLAIGMVVDDAIIVVEIVHTRLEEGESGFDAAVNGMQEISGAIIAISLVLSAIFIPVTFISGSIGVFFTEFGVTLAVAVLISALNALTLSPALCALILKPEHKVQNGGGGFFHKFHRGFEKYYGRVQDRYRQSLEFMSGYAWSSVVIIIFFVLLFGWIYRSTPSGFVPDEDKGAFFANIALPPASSLQRTSEVASRVDSIMANMDAIRDRLTIAGFGIISGAGTPYGFVVGHLKDWDERDKDVNQVIAELTKKTSKIKEANITFFAPPAISGFGNTNGVALHLEDLQAGDIEKLGEVSQKLEKNLMKYPSVQYAQSYFRTDFPQYRVDVNVSKAVRDGYSPKQILDVMQTYYGGLYVNNFTRFGKLYRVYVQAGSNARATKESLQHVFVTNQNGEKAPVTSYVDLKRVYGPQNIKRFNLYNSVDITVGTNAGYSSGNAISAIKKVFDNKISDNYGYAFSGLARQQNKSAGTDLLIFGLCLVFVYFLLSALYESYLVPWSVMLPLPIGLAGSYIFADIFGISNNVYLQIAAIVLLALLAKNAILIVEFAIDRRRNEGIDIAKAAIDGAVARLRPILMTSFAFIAGLLPLAISTGVNSNSNRSIGIGTAGGMFVGTMVGIFVVPILFILFQKLQEKISGPPEAAQQKHLEE